MQVLLSYDPSCPSDNLLVCKINPIKLAYFHASIGTTFFIVIEEVEVTFCYGDKRLILEEFKLVKDDIIQIGEETEGEFCHFRSVTSKQSHYCGFTSKINS